MKLSNKLFLAFLLLSTIDYLGQAQGLPLLSTLCFSQEDNTAKANEYFLAGNKLLEAGNYPAADAEFKKAQDLLKTPARVLPVPVKAERKKAQPELNIPPDMTQEEAVSFTGGQRKISPQPQPALQPGSSLSANQAISAGGRGL